MITSSPPLGSSLPGNDAPVAHAVTLLQMVDDGPFMRWVDICDDLTIRDRHGNTLLHWAAALGQLRALRFLVMSGLETEIRNTSGATPVLCAAATSRNPGSTMSLLLRHGASLRATNNAGADVFALLECRGLHELSRALRGLTDAMESCPRLFASSGFDVGVAFTVDAHGATLGTCATLTPEASTVRFKTSEREGDSALRPSTGRVTNTSSAMHTTEKESDLQPTPGSKSENESAHKDLVLKESAARNEIMRDCAEDRLPFAAALVQATARMYNGLAGELYTDGEDGPCDGEQDALDKSRSSDRLVNINDRPQHTLDPVVNVVGERHEGSGARILLVQWHKDVISVTGGSESSAADGPREDGLRWVPLMAVATSPTVQAYLLRYDNTYATYPAVDDDDASSFGLDRTATLGLDAEERDELERMLGMIPRRQPSPETVAAAGSVGMSSRPSPSRAGNQPADRTTCNATAGVVYGINTGPFSRGQQMPALVAPDPQFVAPLDLLSAMHGVSPVVSESVPSTCRLLPPTDQHRSPRSDNGKPVVWKAAAKSSSSTPCAAPAIRGGSECSSDEGEHRPGYRRFVAPSARRTTAQGPSLADRAIGSDSPAAGAAAAAVSEANTANAQGRFQLSSAEQFSYQRFLYQSAMERLRKRTDGFAALCEERRS